MFTFISMTAKNPTLRLKDIVKMKDGKVKAQKRMEKKHHYVIQYLIGQFKGDVIFSVLNSFLITWLNMQTSMNMLLVS